MFDEKDYAFFMKIADKLDKPVSFVIDMLYKQVFIDVGFSVLLCVVGGIVLWLSLKATRKYTKIPEKTPENNYPRPIINEEYHIIIYFMIVIYSFFLSVIVVQVFLATLTLMFNPYYLVIQKLHGLVS